VKVKTYTFLIGSHDDFEDLDQMLDYFENGTLPPEAHRPHSPNASAHEFEAPANLDRDLVVYIGRGIAFSNDWCEDGTFSTVIEGSLEETEPGQASDEDDSRDYAAPV
jgi:hypothetical protein